MNFSPFTQFEINPLIKISSQITISNFTIYLILSVLIVWLIIKTSVVFFLIPKNYQIMLETIYLFVLGLLLEQTGIKGIRFFPLLFTLFLFLLTSNLMGLLPFSFTITAHFGLTLLLALSFFFGWIIIGIVTLKVNFLRIFIPRGIPSWLLPLLVIIEILSFIIRPFSLAIRLFANLLAGHILLYILSTARYP